MEKAKKENTIQEDTNKQSDIVEKHEINEEHIEKKQQPVFTGVDGTEYSEEEWNAPVVKNGPTRCEIEEWKERYGGIYFTPFEGEPFVWRTLSRPEYREIIRDQTLTALDREEMFTEKCVLFPRNFTIEKMLKSRAGIPSLLSEMIMDKSGFVAQSAPIKL
ncbi:hypothetical protein [Bacillus cereus]|uniref:hypothetical protein n=1 Tax=Bacillus cereus TaxID=1396 RepID=UPI00032EB2A3|nr:hypothetical protein [Bacillus cereus]EOO44552.1 hypothetical protein ICK_06327 [Bacillus cereus BAG1X2-2]